MRPRLRKSREYERVRRQGRSWGHPLLVVQATENDAEVSRFGFVVSRRVGNAVVRNRVRRRLREIVRGVLTGVPAGWDVVLVVRPTAANAAFAELESVTHALLRRARLLPAAAVT